MHHQMSSTQCFRQPQPLQPTGWPFVEGYKQTGLRNSVSSIPRRMTGMLKWRLVNILQCRLFYFDRYVQIAPCEHSPVLFVFVVFNQRA